MPSPVGHALAAAAIGHLASPAPRTTREVIRRSAFFAIGGIIPDVDLIFGRHSAETHSIGFAIAVGLLAALVPMFMSRPRTFLAVSLAVLTHPLLDMLAHDGSPPLGVMFLWPFSSAYIQTGWDWFAPISRRWWLEGFLWHNTKAVLREVLILGPVAFMIFFTGRRIEKTKE